MIVEEKEIAEFWNSHPCGESLVEGDNYDYEQFFLEYDRKKYKLESHILRCLDGISFSDRDVLEIGLGQGAESEQIIRRGARWSGLELTPESVGRVRTRLKLRDLPGEVRQGSVLNIPWQDNSFDIIFSHGVLHHVPDIVAAQREIHRVLRPDGELIVMLYARRSLNYQVSIRIVRRAALIVGYLLARIMLLKPKGLLVGHIANCRRMGVLQYLKMDNFIHRNTDGPSNPFSRVYDQKDLERDFPNFAVVTTHQHFMHAPPLPIHSLPGASRLGWHLWAHLRPRAEIRQTAVMEMQRS